MKQNMDMIEKSKIQICNKLFKENQILILSSLYIYKTILFKIITFNVLTQTVH